MEDDTVTAITDRILDLAAALYEGEVEYMRRLAANQHRASKGLALTVAGDMLPITLRRLAGRYRVTLYTPMITDASADTIEDAFKELEAILRGQLAAKHRAEPK